MKTSVFEKLIRKVVREEIDYALQREIRSLKEDLRNELKPAIKEQPIQRTPIPERVQSSLKEKIMGKKLKKQSFVSNNTLNDLLNETAQGDTNLQSANSPVNLSQPFNTADPIPVETMPTSVANVVNRDYRGLMKAIENKKGR
jgi:beta-lactamase class A